MTADAREAIALIRRCVAADRFATTVHFRERLDQRGLFWPDVAALIDAPADVRSDGYDRFGRPKWLIAGQTATLTDLFEFVCAIDESDGAYAVFITLYWE